MGDTLNTRRMIATALILSVSFIAIATATSDAMDANTIEVGPPGPVHVDDSDVTYIIQSEKPYDVIVFGSGSSAGELVDHFGSANGNVVAADVVSNDKKHLAIMTSDWIVSNPGSGVQFNGFLGDGDMAALFETSIDWSAIEYPKSYPVEAPTVFAMHVEGKMSYCFTRSGISHDEAVSALISWADSKLTGNGAMLMSVTSDDIGSGVETDAEYQNSGYGRTAVRSVCYKLEDSNPDYDYYMAKYHASMMPDGGSFNSGLDVKSAMDDGIMLRHGPGTTSGVTTVGVDTTYTIGTGGLSMSVGETWSYAVSDVRVLNFTDVTNNVLDVRHDVDESKDVGCTTFFAEPGKLIKLESSKTYHSVDTYKSQFCHKTLAYYTAHNDAQATYNVDF